MKTSSLPVAGHGPCPYRLTDDQKSQFQTFGFLAFSEVLTPAQVAQARTALSDLTRSLVLDASADTATPALADGAGVQGGARFARRGGRSSMHLEAGFDPAGKSPEDIELHVRKYWSFVDEAAIFSEIVAPGGRVRGIVDGLLGENPLLFQEMALVKPPLVGSEKPWHQDNAYFSVVPLEAVVGVWIALDDAGPENGCMHVIPGGHRIGAVRHHHGSDCEIHAALLPVERAVPTPLPAGGALFFLGMLPHETPPTRSTRRRRALQFHYRGAHSRVLDDADYDRVFADADGTPASCRSASRRGF